MLQFYCIVSTVCIQFTVQHNKQVSRAGSFYEICDSSQLYSVKICLFAENLAVQFHNISSHILNS